jgi:hypothetical protein
LLNKPKQTTLDGWLGAYPSFMLPFIIKSDEK